MHVLVAYASKHGSTKEIAERIGATLTDAGVDAAVEPVTAVSDLESYDAYVIGSAAYMGSWLPEATRFVRRNRGILVGRPTWLFSSGPIGTEADDEKRREALTASAPVEFREFDAALKPREKQVFYGAYDPNAPPIGLAERLAGLAPRRWLMYAAGDFRDWPEIDRWARAVARELMAVPAAA
jgi:menaquinone-dependent protoporphyrinogen oxidase